VKTISQRLNNIAGQIEGVKKLIDKKEDCLSVLTQLKAVKSAVSSVIGQVVEEQFDNCLNDLSPKQKKLLIEIKKYATN
jgi:DNA-binding FrmR family transcriptional regulator